MKISKKKMFYMKTLVCINKTFEVYKYMVEWVCESEWVYKEDFMEWIDSLFFNRMR